MPIRERCVNAAAATTVLLFLVNGHAALGRPFAPASGEWADPVPTVGPVVVDVQLSPEMSSGPVTRCICFDLYEDCASSPAEVCQPIEFTDGIALDVVVSVAPGTYECMTARDPLHSLRSAADLTFDGTEYSAGFVGNPVEGGSWLIGGNVDSWSPYGNTDVIDLLDFATYLAEVLAGTVYADGNVTCGTAGPHSDINADGGVDLFDFAFIVANFLIESETCCDTTTFGTAAPVLEISVEGLRRRGLPELAVADLNGDGLLSIDDLHVFLLGEAPAAAKTQR